VNFQRLNRWDWVAFLAAFALLFTMGTDWYSTVQGEEARRVQGIEDPNPGASGQIGREVQERAAERAEGAERNAVQPESFIDSVLLVLLFATVVFAGVAAFARAAGRRFEPPGTPSAATAATAAVAALLVAYRIVQQPGPDVATTVKAGAWLSLIVLGIIALASSRALDLEEAGTAFRSVEAPEAPAA
jgi:drug/metabolite transporter (DMT)-like permease